MSLTYDQITAITERHFIPKLADNVYNSNALIARMTRPGKIQLKDGGHALLAPVISSAAGVGGFYDDLDTLDVSRSDNMTSAEYAWKQLYEPIRVSRKEMLQNSGDAGKLNLVASKVKIAESNIRDNLGSGLFSDGTGSSSKEITGLQATLSATSTYGGIAVADMSTWAATVKANGGTNRALSLNLIQQTYGSATEESNKPTVITCKQDVFDQLHSLYQPHQRLVSDEMSKLGFENILTFNGSPVLVDSHQEANTMYFLNEDFLFLAVHKQENLRRETIERLETTNSMLMRIFWMGNLVCNNRRFQAKLSDIEVAA